MDFFALHRRDLQALCKRNGVRANMTNVAMAEALAALPAVDGIEEYVKEPVAVPAPVVEAVAADEKRREKQGSPLPRGRRVMVKAVEASVGKGDVEEDEKREPAKEDPPALGVGRRGPSRRARAAHGVAASVAVPIGKAEEVEDKKNSSNEENQRREANKEDAPAPVVGRRGASRRARPAPAAVSTDPGSGEEQMEIEGTQIPRGRVLVNSSEPIRPDDYEVEEKDDLKQEASTDDAPALGAARRATCRRARPTPALAAQTGKVAEEEKMAPIPRGRSANAKSTDDVKPNDGEDDEKQSKKPEAEADVSALGFGCRGAGRHARLAPALASPAGEVTAEVITLDDNEEAEKDDTKREEKDDGAPAIVVGGRRANTSAPAPEEALVPRRRASTRKTEAVDMAVEAVHIRPTRKRKPTMKAASAAMEKVLPKASRRGTISDVEAVSKPVSNVGSDNSEDSKEASDPRNTVQKQEDESMVIIEDEILMKKTPVQEKALPKPSRRGGVNNTVSQQEEQDKTQDSISKVEAVPEPVSNVGWDSSEDSKEASDPQNRAQKQEDEGMVIIEDEILMKGAPTQELLVLDQECMGYSTLHEDVEKCPALLTKQEDSSILGLVSMAGEQAVEKDKGDNFQDAEGSSEGSSDKGMFKGIHDAGEELEFVPIIQVVVTGDADHESEIGNISELPEPHGTEEASEANTVADVVSQEKECINMDHLQVDLSVGSALGNLIAKQANVEADCSGNLIAKEETTEVNTGDDFSGQEKGDVPDTVAEVIPSCCPIAISWVQMENARDIASEMPESSVALDEDGGETNFYTDICHDDKPSEVVIGDSTSQVGEMLKSVPIIQEAVAGDANQKSEMDNFSEVVIPHDTEETSEFNTVADFVSQEVEDINIDQLQADLAVGSVLLDCSGNINMLAKVDTNEVNTEVGFSCKKGDVDDYRTLPDPVTAAIPSGFSSAISWVQMKKPGDITSEMPESSVALDEDAVGELVETDVVHADELKELVAFDEGAQLTEAEGELFKEDKAGLITEEPINTGIDECVQQNYLEIGFGLDELNNAVTADNLPEVTGANGNTNKTFTSDVQHGLVTEYLSKSSINVEPTLSVSEGTSVCSDNSEKKAVEPVARDITSKMPESPGSLDDDGGLKEVVITEEPQSTDTMDEDVKEHQFENASDEVVTAVSVPDLKISDFEVTEETKTTLIIDEKQSSTVTMDDACDDFETYAVHADELKEVVPTDKVAHLTGTEGDIVEEDKAAVITGEVSNSTGVMVDEDIHIIDLEIGFVLDELNSAVTTDNMPEDGADGNTENTFTCDLPQELNVAEESGDHITPALLADDTEYLSKSIIAVESTVPISEATSVCNDNIEKKAAGPVAMLKEKESVDLLKLSQRQLRAKLKEALIAKKNKEAKRVALARVEALIAKKNKEAKRVALARVDGNVSRSHAKGQ